MPKGFLFHQVVLKSIRNTNTYKHSRTKSFIIVEIIIFSLFTILFSVASLRKNVVTASILLAKIIHLFFLWIFLLSCMDAFGVARDY